MDYVQVIIWVHQPLIGMQCLIWKKVELELFLDRDMYIFFEKGMTDGISYILAIISIWNLITQNKNQNILYT